MKAEMVFHHNDYRIKLDFSYDIEIINKLKQIPGLAWSKTLHAWHLPYSTATIEMLKTVLNIEINLNNTTNQTTPNTQINNQIQQKNNNQTIVPEYKPVLLKITKEIDSKAKKIYISHPYSREIYSKFSQLENIWWQRDKRRWVLANNTENHSKLDAIANLLNLQIEQIEIVPQYLTDTNPQIKSFIETLQMKNYSINTIEAYYPFFKAFLKAHHDRNINSLTYNEIYAYIKNTIAKNNLSETAIRHLISAIKFYFEKTEGRDKMLFFIANKLNIKLSASLFTNQEIKPILNKTNNATHKLILYFKYAIGLNEEELCNLTLQNTKEIVSTIEPKDIRTTIIEAIKTHYRLYRNAIYLFVKSNQSQFTPEEFNSIIFKIVQQYKLVEIYRQMFKDAFAQTNLEQTTLNAYTTSFITFIKHNNYKHPQTITDQEIRNFIVTISQKEQISKSSVNNYINAIKFFYKQILNREFDETLFYRPKKSKRLPEVLSLEEICNITGSIINLKHRCMIELTYSGGLRCSEVLALKVNDIDFGRSVITIRNGKGRKDRAVMLADSLIDTLKQYLNTYMPKEYLYEGATSGQYSVSSLRNILAKAVSLAGITKHVTLHTLRHSFATHLLENGTDIRYIQNLLGHSDIKTTTLYTKVAKTQILKIKSPLDIMREQQLNKKR